MHVHVRPQLFRHFLGSGVQVFVTCLKTSQALFGPAWAPSWELPRGMAFCMQYLAATIQLAGFRQAISLGRPTVPTKLARSARTVPLISC